MPFTISRRRDNDEAGYMGVSLFTARRYGMAHFSDSRIGAMLCIVLTSNAKRYPLCENKRIPFTRNPSVSCLLGRCPNPRRTQKLCSGTMDKSIGCAIFQIACGRAAQRCSASFSRRSFASFCSLSNSRIRSILALAVSSSFISSRAFR